MEFEGVPHTPYVLCKNAQALAYVQVAARPFMEPRK
jgi:hypothetical protein